MALSLEPNGATWLPQPSSDSPAPRTALCRPARRQARARGRSVAEGNGFPRPVAGSGRGNAKTRSPASKSRLAPRLQDLPTVVRHPDIAERTNRYVSTTIGTNGLEI